MASGASVIFDPMSAIKAYEIKKFQLFVSHH